MTTAEFQGKLATMKLIDLWPLVKGGDKEACAEFKRRCKAAKVAVTVRKKLA